MRNNFETIERMTINLGLWYMSEMDKDRAAFIVILKNCFSIASVGEFFYQYLVNKAVIPELGKIEFSKKERYWLEAKDERIELKHRVNICKTVYALEQLKVSL